MKKQYTSLAELRADKQKAKLQIAEGMNRLKVDVADHFMPFGNYFLHSSSKYMNYIGYAITAYRAFTACRGAISFILKLL